MSLIKRYVEDSEAVAERAAVIAWEPEFSERFEQLSLLFGDCGTMAQIYAEPRVVAGMLVRLAVSTYQQSRRSVRGVVVAA